MKVVAVIMDPVEVDKIPVSLRSTGHGSATSSKPVGRLQDSKPLPNP